MSTFVYTTSGNGKATLQKKCSSIKTAKKQVTKLKKLNFAPNIKVEYGSLGQIEQRGLKLYCPD